MASISPGFGCDLCRVCRVCLYQAFMRLTPARTSYKGQPYIPYIDRSIPPFLCVASTGFGDQVAGDGWQTRAQISTVQPRRNTAHPRSGPA